MNFIQQQILHALNGLYYTDQYGINYVWNENTNQYDVAEIPGVEITAPANTPTLGNVSVNTIIAKSKTWLWVLVIIAATVGIYFLYKKMK